MGVVDEIMQVRQILWRYCGWLQSFPYRQFIEYFKDFVDISKLFDGVD